MPVGTFGIRSAEEPPDFVRSEVGYHFCAGLERAGDSLQSVGLHDARHHLAVDRQRDVDFRPFHYGRPVLVADSVTQFDGCMDQFVGRCSGQCREIGHQYVVELDAECDDPPIQRVIGQNVAVGELRAAFECHGIFVARLAAHDETAFLCRPLVEFDVFHTVGFRPFGPLLVVEVADDFRIDLHVDVSIGVSRIAEVRRLWTNSAHPAPIQQNQ